MNSKFDAEYIELADMEATLQTVNQSGITYHVEWKQMSDIPMVFQAITTTWNGKMGPGPVTSRVI